MSKYVEKMNLPQYKYFNNMLKQYDDCQELISDTLTGEYLLKGGNKKDRTEGLMLLSKSRRRMPEFLFCREDDQKRCRKELAAQDIKQLVKKLDQYLDVLLILPFFQGKYMEKKRYLSEEAKQAMTSGSLARKYKIDKEIGKYYAPYLSVPKLLLVNEELYQDYLEREFTEPAMAELDRLLPEDVHYIISVQSSDPSEVAYLVEKNDGFFIQTLDRQRGKRKHPIENMLSERNEITSVLWCLRDYLLKMELVEKQRRKYREEHPDRTKFEMKQETVPRFLDENAIKVFDIKDPDSMADYAGGIFYLSRRESGSSYRKTGYEMIPHTRKGHYRTYKNGKKVYVKASVIHKEKYGGIQAAHRINQAQGNGQEELEAANNTFTQGMTM